MKFRLRIGKTIDKGKLMYLTRFVGSTPRNQEDNNDLLKDPVI
jgi:hypothetical protein